MRSVGVTFGKPLRDNLPHARHGLGPFGNNALNIRHGGLAAVFVRRKAEQIDSLTRRQIFRGGSDAAPAVTLRLKILLNVFFDDAPARTGSCDRRGINDAVFGQLCGARTDLEYLRLGTSWRGGTRRHGCWRSG